LYASGSASLFLFGGKKMVKSAPDLVPY
jgi:hypothetical protein